jgi:hypothetical protein
MVRFTFIGIGLTVAILCLISPANAINFKISGQINRAILWADNGEDNEFFHVDNDNSSTRFRFTGANDFDHGFSVGIVWEVEMQSNPSDEVDIGLDNDIGDVTFNERKIEFLVSQEKAGKVWVGQGSMASDGTSEVDLSGTDVITYSSVVSMAGGISFLDQNSNKLTTVGATRSNFDGLSRQDRIRYDAPKFAGFCLSGSMGNGSIWDVAARYAGDFGKFGKMVAAVAWADGKSRFDWTRFSSSASWLHTSGFNITLNYAKQDPKEIGKDTARTFYVKLSFTRDIHAISVDWTQTEDLEINGDGADTWGAGYVINPWKSVEFYAGWHLYQLDRDGIKNPDDINAVMAGGRIKF